MRTLVTIRVLIPEGADVGDAVQVYTDNGTGTVDLNAPLLARAARIVPAAGKRSGGYGSVPYGRARYGSQKLAPQRQASLATTTFGRGAYGRTPDFLEVTVPVLPGFGTRKFAARLVDEEGNAQGAAAPETAVLLSSIEPPTMRSFAFDSMQGSRARFAIAVNTE